MKRSPAEWITGACALTAALGGVAVIGVLLWEAGAFFDATSLVDVLGDTTWQPAAPEPRVGIWALLAGSLLTASIAVGTALPLGLLAAVHLSEFASSRARAVLKPLLELLAGLPTIVYGVFATLIVIPALQRIVPGLAAFNALGAGLVVGLMILPMVTSLADDALRAVPNEMREAAWALGGRPIPTLTQVVLPAAASGIGAGVILAIARAAGETLIVSLAAGHSPTVTIDPRVPIETMTGYLVRAATGEAPPGSLSYSAIFVVGATLFGLTLVANVVANRFGRRMAERGR